MLALALSSCRTSREGEWYSEWDRAGACRAPGVHAPWGTTPAGTRLGACQGHEGRYLWVLYVADWCGASRQQQAWAAQAFRAFPEAASVAVVMTGGAQVFQAATPADALAWSVALGVPADRVAVEEEGTRTVPQHLLLGPDGRTLWRYVGVLEADRMVGVLEDFRSGRRRPGIW